MRKFVGFSRRGRLFRIPIEKGAYAIALDGFTQPLSGGSDEATEDDYVSILAISKVLLLPYRRMTMLWKRVLADIAEAEFIEVAVGQLMQSIHHVVVTSLKGCIDPRRLNDR